MPREKFRIFAIFSLLIILFSAYPACATPQETQTSKETAIEDALSLASGTNKSVPQPNPSRESAMEKALTTPVRVQISAYGTSKKSQRGLFTADFIIPLYYPENQDTLFFFNPKYTYTTPFANEINQGLGLRHIFNDSFILGINTFFDRRLSHAHKWYSQVGLGLEYLSHPLDVRLNWYKPLTRSKVVDTTYGFGSTSLIQYDNKEEPLQGLDFEFGIPVFDKYTKTRAYFGGFFYQSRLAKNVNGFRARTETSLTNWFNLDTILDSKADGKIEFMGGIRLILPFEWTSLFRKKSKQDTQASADTNTYLEDRIFERVVRDLDIQSKSSTIQSKEHDLVYVDNSNSGSADGSLEHPYSTIKLGVDNAFGDKWVYVKEGLSQDSSPTYYAGNTTLTDSVVLWGSGYNGGFKGLSSSGIYPVISGSANGITLDNNNTVMGLQIQDTTNAGIIFTDGTTLTGTIKYNNISNNTGFGVGNEFNTGDISSFTISNNTINDNSRYGIDFYASDGSISNLTISDNTINSNAAGINLQYNGSSHPHTATITNLTISNNTINGNTNARSIDLGDNEGTISGVTISGNTMSNSSRGIYMNSNWGSISNVTISNNTIGNNSQDAIDLYNNNVTMSGFTISGNTINNATKNGINLGGNGGTVSDFTFTNNTITGNSQDGIILSNDAGSGTMTGINLGNGTTGGHNSIYDNNQSAGAYYDIRNSSGINNLSAQYNWWGTATPSAAQFGGSNTVDYTNPLSANPN